jgi:long-chain acyl-CoA synthetase
MWSRASAGCAPRHARAARTVSHWRIPQARYEQQIDLGPGSVVFMFLPLAHLLARVTQMLVLDVGGTLAYCNGDPKVLVDDLRAL